MRVKGNKAQEERVEEAEIRENADKKTRRQGERPAG